MGVRDRAAAGPRDQADPGRLGCGGLGTGPGGAGAQPGEPGRLPETADRRRRGVSSPTARLAELGLSLPPVPKALAAYLPAVRSGELIFTAGQLPLSDGQLIATGKVPTDVSEDAAGAAARQAALDGPGAAAAEVAGGLDRIAQVVKVVVYVAGTTDFTAQPAVANGASELLGEVFGDAGLHARSAVGVAVLPLNAPVEVELVVRVAAEPRV